MIRNVLAKASVILFLTGFSPETGMTLTGTIEIKTDTECCVYVTDTVTGQSVYSNDQAGLAASPIPLGSVVKIYSLIAKFRNHPVNTDETWFCPGYDRDTPSVSKCWLKKGHGNISLLNALAQSCNTYFYHFVRDVDYGLFLKTLEERGILKGSDNWGRNLLNRDDQYRAMTGKLDILRIKPLDLMVSYAKLFGRDSGLPAEVADILADGLSLCYRNGTASKARVKLGLPEDLPVICKTGTGMYEKDGEVSAVKTTGVFIGIYDRRYLILALARDSTGSDRASLLGLTAVRELRYLVQGGDQ